ncbi:sulfite exporter TauE/SafE family protein [Exiguobacterium acetylicum]|uniref:sulfite exporter TauE/SafE family protein n=1 Tax=Exiguobacterium acetylicum TaxID=41170 RepID=UPI0027E10DC7|nr:sulfite exporter TauE/SafE family protein [Exiguobacterium acetylicum]MDQ6468370.1 sulfite exporter TauE/SafE family protein [Exiguobacterium acetylicum]
MDLAFYYFLILGFFIGIISGFFGIGGGIILTPLLLILGYAPSVAIATSLMLTLGSTVSGTISHLRLKNVFWRDSLVVGGVGIIGSTIATPLVLRLEAVNGAHLVISIVYIGLLLYFANKFLRPKSIMGEQTGWKNRYLALAFTGLFAGFISSLLGVSGGFIITPLLVGIVGYELKRAVGTSIASALLIVLSGLVNYTVASTNIDILVGIMLIVGALLGAPIGAKQLTHFESPFVKKYLGIFYLTVAISVLLEVIGWNVASLSVLVALSLIFLLTLLIYSRRRTNR